MEEWHKCRSGNLIYIIACDCTFFSFCLFFIVTRWGGEQFLSSSIFFFFFSSFCFGKIHIYYQCHGLPLSTVTWAPIAFLSFFLSFFLWTPITHFYVTTHSFSLFPSFFLFFFFLSLFLSFCLSFFPSVSFFLSFFLIVLCFITIRI